ncbi:MAG: YdcF family protein [Gammaproteobacteria bacterium]|nr:YdcF family protein [Gammaproteobacteria bacterium]
MELDVGIRSLIKIALLPPGFLLILLLIGWLWAGRAFGRVVLLLAITALYALSTPVTVSWLAAQLETVPALTPTQLRTSRADAIWILMAGSRKHNPEFNGGPWLDALSLQRVDYGLALHRKTGLPIVLSGGSADPEARPIADIAAEWLRQQAGVNALAVDNSSHDTWENARDSAALFAQHNVTRVLLVTHAYHMPRALLSAEVAGIDAVAAPFAFEHTPEAYRQPGSYKDWLPRPGYLTRSYRILHEIMGLVWYGLLR